MLKSLTAKSVCDALLELFVNVGVAKVTVTVSVTVEAISRVV